MEENIEVSGQQGAPQATRLAEESSNGVGVTPSPQQLNKQIKTFVYLDLESTGLFPSSNRASTTSIKETAFSQSRNLYVELSHEASPMDPQITELALVAVSRRSMVSKNHAENDNELPRDLEIFCRQVRCNVDISSRISGLTSSMLEGKSTFGEIWSQVFSFLDSLAKPACILAHNGIQFDFKLLAFELNRYKLCLDLPRGVHFFDTLYGFQKLDQYYLQTACQQARQVLGSEAVRIGIVQKVCLSPRKRVEVNGQIAPQSIDGKHRRVDNASRRLFSSTMEEEGEKVDLKEVDKEGTPAADWSCLDCPLTVMRKDDWSPAKKTRISPHLFRQMGAGRWEFQRHPSRPSYSQPEIYRDLFDGRQPNDAHSALGDCQTLLKICLKYGRDFVEYVDKWAEPLPGLSRDKLVLSQASLETFFNC